MESYYLFSLETFLVHPQYAYPPTRVGEKFGA